MLGMKSLRSSCLLFTSFLSLLRGEVAPFKRPRPANASGNLFVDKSCIDCDVCRWNTFSRKGIKSIVQTQPESEEEVVQAMAASIASPVGDNWQ